ncbi:MAG: hypothetical protein JXQ87_03775 [Bacteroidia bacterium]
MIWGKIYIVFNYLTNILFLIVFVSFMSVIATSSINEVHYRGMLLSFFVAMALIFNLYFIINTQGLNFNKKNLKSDLIDEGIVKTSKRFKGYTWIWIMPIVTNFALLVYWYLILKSELSFDGTNTTDYFPWVIISIMIMLAVSTVFYNVSSWKKLRNEN